MKKLPPNETSMGKKREGQQKRDYFPSELQKMPYIQRDYAKKKNQDVHIVLTKMHIY